MSLCHVLWTGDYGTQGFVSSVFLMLMGNINFMLYTGAHVSVVREHDWCISPTPD